ncbi:hypothetical protein MKX03_012049 [Papaver bracteatum]|nr:hypothetical protein MKX03_012049 [Papaver bracteatum]
MKTVFAALLFVALLLNLSFIQTTMADEFCDTKCSERCAAARLQDRCLKFCGICCQECNCVPSGTFGNKDECPCYRDKKNSKGESKCP